MEGNGYQIPIHFRNHAPPDQLQDDDDEIYENEFSGRLNKLAANRLDSTQGPSVAIALEQPPESKTMEGTSREGNDSSLTRWKAVSVIALCLSVVSLACLAGFAAIAFSQNTAPQSGSQDTEEVMETDVSIKTTTETPVTEARKPKTSCRDLRHSGITTDGIYIIELPSVSGETPVFCDMSTAGGGWTLVASVRDDSGHGRCTKSNMWLRGNGSEETDAWADDSTFGDVSTATEADYKNAAYHDVEASDVLIWQVPHGVSLPDARISAAAIYHTQDMFLNQTGRTLPKLFAGVSESYRYSSEVANLVSLVYGNSSNVINELGSLIESIPDWYNYKYDGSDTDIKDGGNDMYDRGNRVYYSAGSTPFQPVTYGKNVFGDCYNYHLTSYAHHPFLFLMWIDRNREIYDNFAIKVASNAGADGDGRFATYEATRSLGTTVLEYHAFNVYGASDPSFNVYGANDPSICGIFFYVYDKTKWDSSPASSFSRDTWTGTTDNMEHSVTATGYPAKLFLGYMLLSRSTGLQVFQTQVNVVMDQLLHKLCTVDVKKYGANKETVVPVVFDHGSTRNVHSASNIPSSLGVSLDPGYIQFGSRASNGGILALCPGVRVKNCHAAEYVCIGGVGLSPDTAYCGNSSGWDSTFLIFTR